jgi:hypothetical protein
LRSLIFIVAGLDCALSESAILRSEILTTKEKTMAKKTAGVQNAEIYDGKALEELLGRMIDKPNDFRPKTVMDRLTEHRDSIKKALEKGFTAPELAGMFRTQKVLEVSDQNLRKFIQSAGLAPAKAQKDAKAPAIVPAPAPPATKSQAKPA